MSPERFPLKSMVLAEADAVPSRVAVIWFAEKLPEESLSTKLLGVFKLVASVTSLTANKICETGIPDILLIIVLFIVPRTWPSNSPVNDTEVVALVAVSAFPDKSPIKEFAVITLPSKEEFMSR
eukprot:Lithocolla_globosa_v1_NODE_1716_length_2384_cov_17.167024.p2 type:complete len:124 gc:universal NODE_1716_length_2384_cov_17.167024:1098-1469(+)